MEVKQVYELVNQATKEVLGETEILQEDLTGVVDLGTAVFNANAYDKYVNALVNRIGKVIFVDRVYEGIAPSILMDGMEYGSVVQKISGDWPDSEEDESWQLTPGASYDPNIFYQPKIEVKFFNSKVAFEIPVSITENQVKQSFTSAEQLSRFVAMIYNHIQNSLTVKLDALILNTLDNFIGETIYDEYEGAALNTKSGIRAVNLLYLYNQQFGASLTVDTCLFDLDFLKYASYMIRRYISKLRSASTLYNIGGKKRFTPYSRLQAYLLDDFANASSIYLQSDTYHNELVALPNFYTLPHFQGSGLENRFEDTSKISIVTASGQSVEASGILGVLFDREALGVYNHDRRVTTHYNAKAEFINNWFKSEGSYFNDLNENFVVFFVA